MRASGVCEREFYVVKECIPCYNLRSLRSEG